MMADPVQKNDHVMDANKEKNIQPSLVVGFVN